MNAFRKRYDQHQKNIRFANYSFLLFLFLFISSCSKDQRTVNRIEGSWDVTEATIKGIGTFNTEQIFVFEKCRISKNGYCDFALHDMNNNESTYGMYLVDSDSDQLQMIFTEGLTTTVQTFIIERLSHRKLKLRNPLAQPGDFEYFELRSR